MVRKMLIAAAVMLALFAAPAAAQYDITVTPGRVRPGGTVSISGEGCTSGATVTITLARFPKGTPVVVATTTADQAGKFTTSFKVPVGTKPGRYRVAASCDGAEVASAFVEVTGETPTTAPPSGTGNGTIVRTGSDLNGLGLLGAGLLTLGGLILVATKTRRHESRA